MAINKYSKEDFDKVDTIRSKTLNDMYDRERMKFDDGEIILLDINFFWKTETIKRVASMWRCGSSLEEIYTKYGEGRNVDELFLLLLHLARRGKIDTRKGDIWGRSNSVRGKSVWKDEKLL